MLPVSVRLDIVNLSQRDREERKPFEDSVSFVKTIWEVSAKLFCLGLGNTSDTLSVIRSACGDKCFFHEAQSFNELLSLVKKYNGRVSLVVIDNVEISSYDLERFVKQIEESKVRVVLLNPRIVKREFSSMGDRVEVKHKPLSDKVIRDIIYV